MASASRSYTISFNALDNFTQKYDAITKRLKDFSDQTFMINFDFDESTMKRLDGLNEKLQGSFGGVTGAAKEAGAATKQGTQAHNEAANATEKHTEAGKKHQSLISNLKDNYRGLTGALDDYKEKLSGLAATLTGGAIAGFSWQAASTSKLYSEQMMTQLSALTGSKALNMDEVRAFAGDVAGRSETLSSSSGRLSLLNLIAGRGGKKGSFKATENLEKIFLANKEFLGQEGMAGSTEDLASYATSPYIRSKVEKERLSRFFNQYGVKDFGNKSQAQRVKILGQLDLKMNLDAEREKRPLEAISFYITEIKKAVGKELLESMNGVANAIARIMSTMTSNPMAIKILAWGAALSGVVGALITIVSLLPIIKTGLLALQAATMGPMAILFAVAAIILVIAARTGLLQKAWEKIKGSAMLQDLYNFIEKIGEGISKWYEASGKESFLSTFFTLAEILGTAWDYINKIYTTMRGRGATGLLAGLTALASAPIMLGISAASKLTGVSPEELLKAISDDIKGMYRVISSNVTSFLAKISETMKKVHSIFEWVYGLWQSFATWIKSAIPGAAKEHARKKMEKQAADEGIYLQGNEWYAYNEKGEKSGIKASAYGKAPSEKLTGYLETYKSLPGFAEGVADAIKKGIGNITIKGIDTLISKIESLIDKLSPGMGSPTSNPSNPNGWLTSVQQAHEAEVGEQYGSGYPGYAVGATFSKGGLFKGKVHSPEEIIPRATAIRGPGIISRALDALDARSTSSGASYGDINVAVPIDLSGMKVSSNVDVEMLIKRFEATAKSLAVAAVTDAIGWRRT